MRYGSCLKDIRFTNGIDRNYCCIKLYKGEEVHNKKKEPLVDTLRLLTPTTLVGT